MRKLLLIKRENELIVLFCSVLLFPIILEQLSWGTSIIEGAFVCVPSQGSERSLSDERPKRSHFFTALGTGPVFPRFPNAGSDWSIAPWASPVGF